MWKLYNPLDFVLQDHEFSGRIDLLFSVVEYGFINFQNLSVGLLNFPDRLV